MSLSPIGSTTPSPAPVAPEKAATPPTAAPAAAGPAASDSVSISAAAHQASRPVDADHDGDGH